jgi:hypothetical protein
MTRKKGGFAIKKARKKGVVAIKKEGLIEVWLTPYNHPEGALLMVIDPFWVSDIMSALAAVKESK